MLTLPRSRTYPDSEQEEEVRQGFDPDKARLVNPPQEHNLNAPFAVGDDEEDEAGSSAAAAKSSPHLIDVGGEAEASEWQRRDYRGENEEPPPSAGPRYGSYVDEENPWGGREEEDGR
ncbi:hypothetical protein BDY21DRAFT_56371 [Lineolata rhizophorae]|uniref:Uncharacterized protein n=1 Tax=Lineolata rhizophorae TaxID=578093 RepID=A0A6A6NXB9_9PEZI|nr:hypothetical protein BDY21DRAFT_56371 [Lineolata rhizophorae]